MQGKRRTSLFAVALVLSLMPGLSACRQPASMESFIKAGKVDAFGRYCYDLDLSDSSSTYDISLFTRVDGKMAGSDIVLNIKLVAPDGKVFGEQIMLPAEAAEHNSAQSADYALDYRTDIIPTQYGVWKAYISVPDAPEGFRGLGLKLYRNGER